MNRASIRLTVVVAGVALVAAACATMESKPPAQVVEERQKLMKANGAAWKNVQDNAKTGNWAVVAANADTISKNAAQIPALFPAGSMTEKSKAKPEIWQKKAEFDAVAKKMETEGARLRDTARTGNAQMTNAIIKDFGRNACGACHQPFRVPPPRQS
jgi:cytochrome c556